MLDPFKNSAKLPIQRRHNSLKALLLMIPPLHIIIVGCYYGMFTGKLVDQFIHNFQGAAQQVQRVDVLLFGYKVVEELLHVQCCVFLHMLLICIRLIFNI